MTNLILHHWMAMERRLAALKEEEGQGMVEYVIILALVSVAAIVILVTLGANVNNVFSNVNSAIAAAL